MFDNEALRREGKTRLDVGYMRLTDAAPLVVAQELGLYTKVGLSVRLHREVSWANLRDKLATGALDAAQMLAPLPAMCTLGVSGIRVHVLTGLVLSCNGNAITLNATLNQALQQSNLKTLVQQRKTPLTLATVHAFSTHTLQLRRWLRGAGVNPDTDVRLVVVPPSQMVESLEMELIDGFCAGEPWNTIAVRRGVGEVAVAGQQIWPGAPEKVLAVRADAQGVAPEAHLRLRAALLQACTWLHDPAHVSQVAAMLADVNYLDLPVAALLPALAGSSDTQDAVPTFAGPAVNRPNHSLALSMVHDCAEMLGKPLQNDVAQALVHSSWRPDLYSETLQALSEPVV